MNAPTKAERAQEGTPAQPDAARAAMRASTDVRETGGRSRLPQKLPAVAEQHGVAVLQALLEQERSHANDWRQRCREAEEAAVVQRAAMERLSHDLRTPLAAIVAWTAVLQRGPADAAMVREALGGIERCARRQADLLDRSLARGAPRSGSGMAVDAAVGSGTPSVVSRLDGITLLLVDDEAEVRHALTHTLRAAGAVVYPASDAAEAMTLLRLERPQLMVCDVEMPGCDGCQLLRRIRQLPAAAGGSIPALALSGLDTDVAAARSLQCGFHRHLHKGVRNEALLRAIHGLAAARVQNSR